MKVRIYRGANTIGGNCIALEVGNERLILDAGIPLTEAEDDIDSLEWDDPNWKTTVLISHAHQDHYGLITEIPEGLSIYTGEMTKEIFKVMNIFAGHCLPLENVHILPPFLDRQIGAFKIRPYLVDHSGPGAYAYLITAGDKRVFYTGDYRAHGNKGMLFEKLLENPPKDIDLVITEGTMFSREDTHSYKSEEEVRQRLCQIFQKDGLKMVVASSQNLDRICQIYKAVLQTDSMLVIDPYTAYVLEALRKKSPRSPGWDSKNIWVKMVHHQCKALVDSGHASFLHKIYSKIISIEEVIAKRKKCVLIIKDNYLVKSYVKRIPEDEKIKVVWSMWEGYLEESKYIFPLKNDHDLEVVHTSGHAYFQDVCRLIDALKPKKIMPVHSLNREKLQDRFSSVEIVDNGCTLNI